MSINKKTRELVYLKYDKRCSYCGNELYSIKDMEVDHIIPKKNFFIKNNDKVPYFLVHLKEGDVDHYDNLNPSCRACNGFKGTLDLETFRSELSKQIERANKYSVNYRMAKRYGLVEENIMPIVFYFENID